MQPTSSRLESLPDSATKKKVLGGTKVGNGAWALAYIDTVMEFSGSSALDETPEAKARERILKEVENSVESPIELS